MGRISIYGDSDDCVIVEGINGTQEIDAYDCGRCITVTTQNGEGLKVYAEYAPRGVRAPVWVIGVAPLAAGVPLPHWGMSYSIAENWYSAELTIVAPGDFNVRCDDGR